MRKQHITLSLSEGLIKDLHMFLPRRQISAYTEKLLQESLDKEKAPFIKDCIEASQDEERLDEAKLWDTLIGDGLDETNAY